MRDRPLLFDMAATLTFALLSAVRFVSALSPTSIETYLEDHLSSSAEVYLSSDPGYSANLTARWNGFEAPSYVIGVKPATALDVSVIVSRSYRSLLFVKRLTLDKKIKYAQQNGIAFMGTGGGHGYTVTTGAIKNGINIDLSGFDSVTVDKAASKMTIGGAVTFGEVFDPVFAAGKEIRKYDPGDQKTNADIPSRNWFLLMCWHGWRDSWRRHWSLPRSARYDHRCTRVRHNSDWKGRHRECVGV